ncbi:MAG TPA: hypothetical protein DCL77_07875, partial [Prolixibacteraceae bacterium]|nr:hypothetical protein [Prolixibacteraceae bacterium]
MKNQLMKIIVIAFIGLALFSCKKEDPLNAKLTTYTTREGLFNNYVNNIVIDPQGNPIVGCGSYSKEKQLYEGGISKFDGTNWT